MSSAASLAILFPTVLLPLCGLYLLTRKRKWCVLIGWLCVLFFTAWMGLYGLFVPCSFDSLVGWKMELSVEIPGYGVVLVQRPSSDFYNSTFMISRADGRTASVSFDNDDTRWWRGRLHSEGSKVYFLRGLGRIDEQTSYVDREDGTLYSGYHKTRHTLSELDYN